MDVLGWALLTWLVVSAIALCIIEAAAVLSHRPTISDRVRALGRAAPIVVIWVCLAIGYLAAHFWDGAW